MRFFLYVLGVMTFCSGILVASAQEIEPITRRDGFLLLWQSIARPVDTVKERPFQDVHSNQKGFSEITYAKARGILDEADNFSPDDPLDFDTAMLWLFRTRSIESPVTEATIPITLAEPEDITTLLERYQISRPGNEETMTQDDLLNYMRSFDAQLDAQEHEVSLYAEKFHGKGTAFGETFNMYSLTAAHRSYPYNTLVEVTNVANGKKVIVRINDRGPFLKGRDMDLSLAAFTTIADRSSGKFQATFRRLGDAGLAMRCNNTRFYRRITGNLILKPGIPHHLWLNAELNLASEKFFSVISVTYPDGLESTFNQWISPDETFHFTPGTIGTFTFLIRDKFGKRRSIPMNVVDCSEE